MKVTAQHIISASLLSHIHGMMIITTLQRVEQNTI